MAKILIIDDEISIRSLFKRILKDEYIIKECGDGVAGLKMVREEDFDLIFLDIKLPFSDGFDIMKKIKEIKPNIKIIIMTGDPSKENIKKTKEISADGFIAKPFNIMELKEIVSQILQT